MGWSYGQLPDGKEVGYSVEATCEYPGCTERIDRGLSYKCGPMHGAGANYCDGYFCEKHLLCTAADGGLRCFECAKLIPDDEGDDELSAARGEGER